MKKKNLFLFMLLLLSSYYDMDAQDVSPVKIPFETALNTTKELVGTGLPSKIYLPTRKPVLFH